MNMTQYGLIYAGLSSIALGIFHLPRIWGAVFHHWDAEIGARSLLTRKLINTVLIALCLAVVALGSATLIIALEAAVHDGLAFWLLFFCFLFWLWRLAWQILYFPYRKLKLGKGLLSLHISLIFIFAANTLAYLAPVITAVIS